MPFIPLDDDNPTLTIERPWVTWGMLAICGFIFLLQAIADPETAARLIWGLGLIPATISGTAELKPDLVLLPSDLTLLSYMFLHGSPAHLVGNLLYLWVFGDNIEDAMGHARFLLFYLLCGILAGIAQIAMDPASAAPTIGASGAISGILGAYLVLHPKSKILVPILFIPVRLPAWILLLAWIGFQFYSAALNGANGQEAIAWWAHIGGFVVGMILIVPLRYKILPLFGGGGLPSGVELRDRSGKRKRD